MPSTLTKITNDGHMEWVSGQPINKPKKAITTDREKRHTFREDGRLSTKLLENLKDNENSNLPKCTINK